MERPLSESLQKLRRAQQALGRRKRRSKVRVSFSHSSAGRPSVNCVGGVTRRSPVRQLTCRHVDDSRQGSRPTRSREPHLHAAEPAGFQADYHLPQADGQCCSHPRRRAHNSRTSGHPDHAQDSVMPVEGRDSPYWGALSSTPAQASGTANQGENGAGQRVEYARLGTLDNGRVVHRPMHVRRQGFRGPAPPAAGPEDRERQKPPKRDSGRVMASRRHGVASPVTMESIRRSLSQQHRLSMLASPPCHRPVPSSTSREAREPNVSLRQTRRSDPGSSGGSEMVSRSSSQQHAIDRFTRELAKFAAAAGTSGAGPVSTPTASNTALSLQTVEELLPFREQFLAAGLAVTSADQHRQSKPQADKAPGEAQEGQEEVEKPSRLQLDGETASSPAESTSSNDASSDTIILFRESDALALALADEAPPQKANRASGDHKARHKIPWLRRKALPAAPRLSRPSQAGDFPVRSPARKPPPVPPGPKQADSEPQQTERAIWLERDKSLPPLPPVARMPSQPRRPRGSSKTKIHGNSRQIPATIEEVPEPSSEKRRSGRASRPKEVDSDVEQEQPWKEISDGKTAKPNETLAPLLPETWKQDVSTPSSLGRALDDVVRKLQELDENQMASEARLAALQGKRRSKKAASPAQRLEKVAAMRRSRIESSKAPDPTVAPLATGPASKAGHGRGRKEEKTRPGPARNGLGDLAAVGTEDRDISDRDVLRGLKLAISAACDEALDASIRAKTGLRLRRFLADLRSFEDLEDVEEEPVTGRSVKAHQHRMAGQQPSVGKGQLDGRRPQ